MSVSNSFWRNKKVLVTGHTGFKGGWLSLWLAKLGARVTGLALDPPTDPCLFVVAGIGKQLVADIRCDVRDRDQLAKSIEAAEPEILFHLAAQPLVRDSYQNPAETYATNVMGTVHMLEAVRAASSVRAVVNVTTDKCYENREWIWPYRENEPMGGHDPYSSSKGCAELVTSAYRRSFLAADGKQVASARAGNVIGGGDWAADRLLPDFLRAISVRDTLVIRSPRSIRPWQHVLEPLAGYLMLAQALYTQGGDFADGWNFGPEESDAKSVHWIVERLCELEPEASWRLDERPQPHEASTLMLSSMKAKSKLGWKPRLNLRHAVAMTLDWHRAWRSSRDMAAFCLQQIDDYQAACDHDRAV